MKKYLLIGLGFLAILSACKDKQQDEVKLKDGAWYAEFNVSDGTIPFIFDVKNDSTTTVTLINGDEKVVLSDVSYQGDTVIIPIKAYDTQLKGVLHGDTLKGVFSRLFAENDPGVNFTAIAGNTPRFPKAEASTNSLSGKWDIQFIADDVVKNNVGIFAEKDGVLTGSVLTNSGDLRYLEGVNNASGFRLSAFAGLSPYLIEGNFVDADHFEGKFITSRGSQVIKGTRNANASLADPYSLTKMNKGYNTLGFKLPDLEGNTISLSDSAYKDKVVIISILGSWCPNCLDEMEYLSPWYKENKDRGVEIIGLSFERKDDPEYVNKVLSNLIKRYDPSYKIVFGGKLGNETNVLPEIDKLSSYPTTIFIDKKGNVRKIHTGYNGPATGLFYEEFKEDFNNQVNSLLAE